MDNAELQKLLSALGVTVKTDPQAVPDSIFTFLTDYRTNSPARCFFTCDQVYFSPDELSLYSTLYTYQSKSSLTQAEKDALIKAGVSEMIIDHFDNGSFTREDVLQLLSHMAYLPSFAEDLHGALIEAGFADLTETDRYYHFATDTNEIGPAYNIRLYNTSRADTVVVLFSDYTHPASMHAAAFRIVDGEYKLHSYTPL